MTIVALWLSGTKQEIPQFRKSQTAPASNQELGNIQQDFKLQKIISGGQIPKDNQVSPKHSLSGLPRSKTEGAANPLCSRHGHLETQAPSFWITEMTPGKKPSGSNGLNLATRTKSPSGTQCLHTGPSKTVLLFARVQGGGVCSENGVLTDVTHLRETGRPPQDHRTHGEEPSQNE